MVSVNSMTHYVIILWHTVHVFRWNLSVTKGQGTGKMSSLQRCHYLHVKIQSSVSVNVMQMSLLGRRGRGEGIRAGAAFSIFWLKFLTLGNGK